MQPEKGLLLVVSGPSGAGKGTVCKRLREMVPQLSFSVSVTTRAPRPGEEPGRDYVFVSRPEFWQMANNGELLEWAHVYGNYYGTPTTFVERELEAGRDVLLEIEMQGALQVRQSFDRGVFVFVLPPSPSEQRRRMEERGSESDGDLQIRLQAALNEIQYVWHYNYVVVNDDVDKSARTLQSVLIAERCQVHRNREWLLALEERIKGENDAGAEF